MTDSAEKLLREARELIASCINTRMTSEAYHEAMAGRDKPCLIGLMKRIDAHLSAHPVTGQGDGLDAAEIVGHKTFIEKGGVFRHEPLTRGEAERE